MSCDFIDDGYTEEGYIAADENGFHGPLEFTYRPAVVAERDAVNRHITKAEPNYEAFLESATKAIAKSLKTWSLKNQAGDPVKVSEANVRKVRARLFDRLWAVVSGAVASDPRPDGSRPVCGDPEADAKN